MNHVPKKSMLIFCGVFAILGLLTIFILTSEGRGSAHQNKIIGIVFDLANQPISGAPFMLYPGDKEQEECMHACMSNSAGIFEMPKPGPGVYHLVTIIEKERLFLRPFRILARSDIIEIKFIYTGAIQAKVVKKPVLVATRPHDKPRVENRPKPDTPESSQSCVLQGTIFLENKPAANGFVCRLTGEHIEKKKKINEELRVENGKYKVSGLTPGPYSFVVSKENYPAVKIAEMFLLSGQPNSLDIYLQSKVIEKQQPTADVLITVIDAGWTPQAGANVTIIKLDGGFQKIEQTNQGGDVRFEAIPAGDYRITAVFNGIHGQCSIEEVISAVPGKLVSLVLRESE